MQVMPLQTVFLCLALTAPKKRAETVYGPQLQPACSSGNAVSGSQTDHNLITDWSLSRADHDTF